MPDKPGRCGSWMFSAQTGPPAPDCFLLFSEQSSASFYFFRNTLFQTQPVRARFSKTENRDSKLTVTDFLHVQRSKLSWPFSVNVWSLLRLCFHPKGFASCSKAFLCCTAVFRVEVGSSYPPPCHSPFSYCCKYRLSQEGQ